MFEKIPVIAIVGPTASGKTALGISVAKFLDGEVVSADSMQIYKGLEIASAAPTKAETDGVPHHLIGFAEPSNKFSVAEYIKLAKGTIEDINSRGKTPIIVGGTGLYVDSLLGGVEFPAEENLETREKLVAEAEQNGMEYMLNRLKEKDPDTAKKLHVNDKKRIIRALEVIEIHGKTMTELKYESKQNGSPYNVTWIGLDFSDRGILYDRIDRRVDLMLENGLLSEAEKSFKEGLGNTAVQAIGHKEFYPYFKGETSLEEAVETLKSNTRHYAKRQLTWFRRNKELNVIFADKQDTVTRAKEILKL
jgi:tRNA dimethylallyltransferase